MIEIKNISKTYDREVLKGISYEFDKGKIYVIKGVSGCGKSTLLNIIGGVETNYNGEYLCEGKNIKNMGRSELNNHGRSCAYIFQNSLLISGVTVLENLLYINNDEEKIRQYAVRMNVEELLEKYPEQLSGGERQRISIIRALIINAEIILADEPTASLDNQNACDIAQIFDMLRSEERIIIIATHADCFDGVADEIIHLDYGLIGEISKTDKKEKDKELQTLYQKAVKKRKNSWRALLKMVFKRNQRRLKITALLPMIFVVMAVLICFGVQCNFSEESMKYYQKNYPMDMIHTHDYCIEMIQMDYEDVELYVYNLYTIEMEDYVCYPMYGKEDSVLAYGNLIKYGHFPECDTEVLISNQMAKNMAGSDAVESCIGKNLDIKGTTYTVVGVLADMDSDRDADVDVYNGDWYYKMAEVSDIVYMSYDMISQYGEEVHTSDYMVKIPGLYETEGLKEKIGEKIGYNFPWEWKLSQAQDTADTVNNIIMIAFVVVAIMAAIFIKTDIEVDLFYRKKELGYMQIFGVKKRTIWFQIILEKMSKNIMSYACALVLFHIVVIALKTFMGINGFVTFEHIVMLFFIVLGFSFISVILPIRKFMKKSVLKLITE